MSPTRNIKFSLKKPWKTKGPNTMDVLSRLSAEMFEAADRYPAGQVRRILAGNLQSAREATASRAVSMPPADDPRVEWRDASIEGSRRNPAIPVRIYQPVDGKHAPCGLLFLHGGAFCFGSPEEEHPRTLRIAAMLGIVVVSVGYRLAPEHPYPAGLNDAYHVLQWMRRNAPMLRFRREHLLVGGASAGGCLAAALAIRSRDRGGPPVSGQLLIYPVLDDRLDTPSMASGASLPIINSGDCHSMWAAYRGSRRDPSSAEFAPARLEDFSGLPPACILVAEHDPLRDEALDYGSRLLAAGCGAEIHNMPGAVHGYEMLSDGPLGKAGWAQVLSGLARLAGIAPSKSPIAPGLPVGNVGVTT